MAQTKPNIAFISSALSPEGEKDRESFDFFAVLLGGIVNHTREKLSGRVVVYIPKKTDRDATDQGDLITEVLSIDGRYDAIVIAPFDTIVVKAELDKFGARLEAQDAEVANEVALIFVDKMIDPTELPESLKRRFHIVNVGCNNVEGGEKAARLLLEALKSKLRRQKARPTPENCKFIVLRGLEGGEDRAAGFEAAIRKQLPGAPIHIADSEDLNFTRAGARRWMEDQLYKLTEDGESDFGLITDYRYRCVFACNDEMALGVHAVISARHRLLREQVALANYDNRLDENSAAEIAELIFLQNILIVGFDGIGAARDLVCPVKGARDPWFVGTIGAKVEQQSAQVIDWIKRLRNDPATRAEKDKSSVVRPEEIFE